MPSNCSLRKYQSFLVRKRQIICFSCTLQKCCYCHCSMISSSWDLSVDYCPRRTPLKSEPFRSVSQESILFSRKSDTYCPAWREQKEVIFHVKCLLVPSKMDLLCSMIAPYLWVLSETRACLQRKECLDSIVQKIAPQSLCKLVNQLTYYLLLSIISLLCDSTLHNITVRQEIGLDTTFLYMYAFSMGLLPLSNQYENLQCMLIFWICAYMCMGRSFKDWASIHSGN